MPFLFGLGLVFPGGGGGGSVRVEGGLAMRGGEGGTREGLGHPPLAKGLTPVAKAVEDREGGGWAVVGLGWGYSSDFHATFLTTGVLTFLA